MEPLLDSQEAAKLLGIRPKVLERWARKGELPALKIGKYWRYRMEDLEAWVNSRVKSASQPCRPQFAF